MSTDLVQRGPLYLHGHAEVPLVLAAVDVVQVVDGVLHDAVACLAVIPVAWQREMRKYTLKEIPFKNQ